MSAIIDVRDVSMCFRKENEKTDTLKEFFVKLVQRRLRYTEFRALNHVNFAIQRGEAVALIGVNGSGKSTMLKLIAGVMDPTEGDVAVNGTIAPLIELGAGFDVDLTARENIFLNGALLGHNRREMQKNFDRIVDFAELWDFLDAPIRSFSSGMIARLGFAIATEVKADILVVLFVSHNTDQVKELCPRAIWLDHGNVMLDGPSAEVCDTYLEQKAQA